ncbi:MAG TPA: glycosyltransferase family 2 protein [Dongiaceae bacterium]|nr:glycosyltransferase family 2 protein [Dongiaceae bacterium]
MNNSLPHISVCACTYKRPELLTRLLNELAKQETRGLFTFSVVVVDNDQTGSAEAVVEAFASTSSLPVTYFLQPVQNICLARNTAIENATGEYVVFIDDDEFPQELWLVSLFLSAQPAEVDGVLGPVKSHFDQKPPDWVIQCRFFERPTHPTGFVIDWREGRTGNVLLKRRLFTPGEPAFNPDFHRGGDTDFFRRKVLQGHRFIWCDEAGVLEVVPPARWSRGFMLKRALLRGSITVKSPSFRPQSVAKSVVAAGCYIVALPFAFLLGQDRFMNLLVRCCDHLGKILAFVGINPVKSPYVTD